MVHENSGTVVLVHGLWMHGVVFFRLKALLERHGFSTRTFSYPTVRQGLSDNAQALARFVTALEGERIHLVGHSLGGLVILTLLVHSRDPRIERAVLLGTPCRGSHCAAALARLPGMSTIVGRSIREWRPEHWRPVPQDIRIGVISGDRSIGTGRIFRGLPKPNDGIVAVKETCLPNAADAITLHVAHSEMLFSRACAEQVTAFLRTGAFLHPATRRKAR